MTALSPVTRQKRCFF